MTFYDWAHRHLAAKPTPYPRSTVAPFKIGDRVVVSPVAMDAMFVGGQHGAVVDVEPMTDPKDAFYPWAVHVRLDNGMEYAFDASELTLEKDPPAEADEEDFAADGEVPPTPLFDDVVSEAEARDGLAAEVEAYLAHVAQGGAS